MIHLLMYDNESNLIKSKGKVTQLTCMRRSTCASVLAVVSALVNLASLPSVARLAATLGHLTGIEEAAPAILTLNITGPRRWRCVCVGGGVLRAC